MSALEEQPERMFQVSALPYEPAKVYAESYEINHQTGILTLFSGGRPMMSWAAGKWDSVVEIVPFGTASPIKPLAVLGSESNSIKFEDLPSCADVEVTASGTFMCFGYPPPGDGKDTEWCVNVYDVPGLTDEQKILVRQQLIGFNRFLMAKLTK